jgi:hypothetical protein
MDVIGVDPRVVDHSLHRRGADLAVGAPIADLRVDLEVVRDHLEHSVNLPRVVNRGQPLGQVPDCAVEDDCADLVHRHGYELEMLDPGVAPQCGSYVVLYLDFRLHAEQLSVRQ